MFKKKKISKAKIACRGSCRRRRWLINAIRVFKEYQQSGTEKYWKIVHHRKIWGDFSMLKNYLIKDIKSPANKCQ